MFTLDFNVVLYFLGLKLTQWSVRKTINGKCDLTHVWHPSHIKN